MPAPSTRHLTQLLQLTPAAALPPVPAKPRGTGDPYRLALSVTHADGRITRWGPDEVNSTDVPTGLSFGTSIPGGFKDMTCELLRRIDVDYPDEALFDSVRVYGPGNETGWEGRVAQLPRQHGDQFSVQPGAVGWAAHLEDDPSFREIYVDRDLTHWEGPSVQRRLDVLAASQNIEETGGVVADPATGQPALKTQLTGAWGRTAKCEAWYLSPGISLGTVIWAWKNSAPVGTGDANWTWQVFLSDDDVASSLDTNGDQRTAPVSTPNAFSATTSSRTAAFILQQYTGAAGTGGTSYDLFWTLVAVYGNHDLTLHGPIDATTGYGVYASDVVADVVRRAAPLLTYSTGADGSISPTSFVIPHLAFLDPTKGSDAISLVNSYHLYEWGVYDGREFFWRPPDPDRLTWEARLSDGAQVSLEGDDANNLFNGVFVTYTDPIGKKKTVGPPGATADATDVSLVDTDPDNPVNAHSIPRRWGVLDVSNTTTQAGAIQLGAVWLAEHRLPSRRGQLTLTGLVQHPTQGKRPVWAVRAGDFIRIADRPNDPARRIIETRYDHDTRKLTASLDQTVFRLEALIERMGVSLVGVI